MVYTLEEFKNIKVLSNQELEEYKKVENEELYVKTKGTAPNVENLAMKNAMGGQAKVMLKEVKKEFTQQLKQEAKSAGNNFAKELGNEIKSDVKNEVKSTVKDEVRSSVKNGLKGALKGFLR